MSPSSTDITFSVPKNPSPDNLADWMEIKALLTGSCSYEYARKELLPTEAEEAKIQTAINAAYIAIEKREVRIRVYPFQLSSSKLEAKPDSESSSYVFQLLLSFFGEEAYQIGQDNARIIFEWLSLEAACEHFNSDLKEEAYRFGFPRKEKDEKSFKKALDKLCGLMGEGEGHRPNANLLKNDAGLDIVIWKNFSDNKKGKWIAFGQCATGKHWEEKRTELQPQAFCRTWLNEPFFHDPAKLFFIPHIIANDKWEETCRYAGIVFDRIRIADQSKELSNGLEIKIKHWCQSVIKKIK